MDKPLPFSSSAPTPTRTSAPQPAAPAPWKRTSQLLEDELQHFTLVWLKGLPDRIRPLKCAQHYPRVLNKLAALWSLDERCIDFLDELLTDRRGERQGFGYGIPGELRLLRMHRAANLTRPEPPAADFPQTDFQSTVPMPLEPPSES